MRVALILLVTFLFIFTIPITSCFAEEINETSSFVNNFFELMQTDKSLMILVFGFSGGVLFGFALSVFLFFIVGRFQGIWSIIMWLVIITAVVVLVSGVVIALTKPDVFINLGLIANKTVVGV